jgi:hypothetical protein
MISMAFVEQPESVSTRYETSNQTRGVAAFAECHRRAGIGLHRHRAERDARLDQWIGASLPATGASTPTEGTALSGS